MNEIKFLKRDLARIKMENEELLTEVERLKKNPSVDPEKVKEMKNLKKKLKELKEEKDTVEPLKIEINEKDNQVAQISQNLKERTEQNQNLHEELSNRDNKLKIKAQEIQQYKDECKKLQGNTKYANNFREKEVGYKGDIAQLEAEINRLQDALAGDEKNSSEVITKKNILIRSTQEELKEKIDKVDLLSNELTIFSERYNSLLDVKDIKGKSGAEKLKKLLFTKEKEVYNSKQIEAALRLKLRETLDKLEKYKGTDLFSGNEDLEDLKNRIIELSNKVKEYTLKYTQKNSECVSLRTKLKEAGDFCIQIANAKPVLKKIEDNNIAS